MPKLKKLKQTDGRAEKPKFSTIDQVLGDRGMRSGKYKTLDLEEYTQYLKNLSKTDLQAHAIDIGLVPVDNAETLHKRLLREFNKYVASYNIPRTRSAAPTKEVPANIQQILSAGR